ncbi:ribosomal protein L49/IMG2, partial [Geopyxis carbonaria]
PLPYFVHRTKSKNLPVYYKQKRDGQHQTTIRKLEGDLSVLKTQLAESLDVHPDWIDVKNLKRHVIVRASVKEKVEQFLEQKKF